MANRFSQLKALINQSFQIFNVYGRQAESVQAIIGGFSMVLKDIHIDDITLAFREWMHEESNMPTPVNILKIATRIQKENEERARGFVAAKSANPSILKRPPWIAEFNSGMVKPETVGKLKSFLLSLNNEERARTYCGTMCNYDEIMKYDAVPFSIFDDGMRQDCVPWLGLLWHEFDDDLREKFMFHIENTLKPEKRETYIKFSRHHIGIPQELYFSLMEKYGDKK
jgi:hypothetical protein